MSLPASDARLVRLSAAIALGHWDELRTLRRSAPAGEPDRRWREVVLQAHLFAGFPRVVEAASVLAGAGGLGTPAPEELDVAPDAAAGRALFDAIYAEQAPAVRTMLASSHPVLAHWIAEHAYAGVLSRPGLPADRRELCAVAALAAQGQDRQLAAHARGAVRLGAKPVEVSATLDAIADLLAPAALERARAVVALFAGPSED